MTTSNKIWAIIIRPIFGLALLIAILFPVNVITASEIKNSAQLAQSIENDFNNGKQIVLDTNSTLDDYLAYAALNNPGLKSAFYNWQASLENITQAKSLPDPVFTYGQSIGGTGTLANPQERRFSLMQTLPWPGTLAGRKNMAYQEANAAYKQFESTRLKLFYDVKSVYYDLYLLGREIQLTNDHLDILARWEAVALTNYKNSLGQYPDLIKIQLEQAKLDNMLTTLKEMGNPLTARFKAILNMSTPEDLSFPKSLPEHSLGMSHDSLATLLVENNTELRTMDYLIAREKESIGLAKKAYVPDLMLGIDYTRAGGTASSAMNGGGKNSWMINAGFNLPIWFSKNNAARKQARARFEAARNNKQQTENQLVSNLENSLFEYQDAVRKIDLYQDELIPKARQSLNATYTAYQTGKVDFLSVIDTQRMLLDFQLDFEKELVNKAKSVSEIELLIGAKE